MTRLAITAAAAVVLAAGLIGCTNRGSGEVKSETRQVAAFTRIEVGGGIGLTVRMGPAQPLEVRAQENILPLIVTEIQGDTLKISAKQAYTTSEGVSVTIVVPTLAGISMSGGSQGTVDGIQGDSFTAELNGGAGLTAAGTADTVTLELSGGTRASLEKLAAKTISVEVSGGSTANVNASDEVSGSASGGSHVFVAGGARLNVQVSGGSEARNL